MRVLVFTRTAGYRHESIEAGVAALGELAADEGFEITATEDAAVFCPPVLDEVAAVVFLNTSGDVFTDAQRAAFRAYVEGGGGFVGVHCAAATETGWRFFAELVGARFVGHPPVQQATLRVEDRDHPATAHLDEIWIRTDEWYDFAESPRGRVHVLLRIDESSYSGGKMGADHPLAWCHEVGAARAFYTALGHTVESYAEPAFREHLLGGIRWVTARAPQRVSASGVAHSGNAQSSSVC